MANLPTTSTKERPTYEQYAQKATAMGLTPLSPAQFSEADKTYKGIGELKIPELEKVIDQIGNRHKIPPSLKE